MYLTRMKENTLVSRRVVLKSFSSPTHLKMKAPHEVIVALFAMILKARCNLVNINCFKAIKLKVEIRNSLKVI